jgi:hypothetical protein
MYYPGTGDGAPWCSALEPHAASYGLAMTENVRLGAWRDGTTTWWEWATSE